MVEQETVSSAGAKKVDRSHDYVMYLIINDSLGQSGEKAAAQIGHAVMEIVDIFHSLHKIEPGVNNEYYKFEEFVDSDEQFFKYVAWRRSPTKVVLHANEEQWRELKKLNCLIIVDEGRTEVPPNSETVMGFWPMKKSERPELIKSLKTKIKGKEECSEY